MDRSAGSSTETVISSSSGQLLFHEHRLHSIRNFLLPVEHSAATELLIPGEQLALEVDGAMVPLCPEAPTPNLSLARLRAGHLLMFRAPMPWATQEGLALCRTVELLPSDPSSVQASMRFRMLNTATTRKRASLKWQLQLPPCQAMAANEKGELVPLAAGRVPLSLRQLGYLLFSLGSSRVYAPGNQVLEIKFRGLGPHTLSLTPRPEGGWTLDATFSTELQGGAERDAGVQLNYRVLLPKQLSSTVFLVARPDDESALWQGAAAAVTGWVDPLERYPGFSRLAPLLWFDRERPLSSTILRFLHNLASLRCIIVIGEVLPHDLENLLTALLDRGDDRQLRLQLFTVNEYFRDRVNVLRGNIQARMLLSKESPERVKRMETLVSAQVVSDPDLLPLQVHRFFLRESQAEPIETRGHERSAILVPANLPDASHIVALCAPLARQIGAPVFLWSPHTEEETLATLSYSETRLVLALGCANDEKAAEELQLRLKERSKDIEVVPITCAEASLSATVLARLFKVKWLVDFLIGALQGEHDKIPGASLALAEIVRQYIASVAKEPWARHLETIPTDREKIPVIELYKDLFICCDVFISSCKEFFTRAAHDRPELRQALAPIWNDTAVLCDYVPSQGENSQAPAERWSRGNASLNLFPAASFAAYHDAALLLFPAVPPESTPKRHRSLGGAGEYDILSVDALMTLQALRPLTLAIYSSNPQVQFETLRDHTGVPLGLKFVVCRLCGSDPMDTSLVTFSGSVHAEALKRKRRLHALLWGVNVKQSGGLKLDEELDGISAQLTDPRFVLTRVSDREAARQACERPSLGLLMQKLRAQMHLFHFAGHAGANRKQPMLSGLIVPHDADPDESVVVTALKLRYDLKLSAAPIVFINACDASYNGSQSVAPITPQVEPDSASDPARELALASESQRVVGLSSSFIHIGAAAVIAPLGVIQDPTACSFAINFYRYLREGCSVGEAALLARSDGWQRASSPQERPIDELKIDDLKYVIHGDPTLRLDPLDVLLRDHPATAQRLIQSPSIVREAR